MQFWMQLISPLMCEYSTVDLQVYGKKYWSSKPEKPWGFFNNSHTTPETLKHFPLPWAVWHSPSQTQHTYIHRQIYALPWMLSQKIHWVDCQQKEPTHDFTTKGSRVVSFRKQGRPNLWSTVSPLEMMLSLSFGNNLITVSDVYVSLVWMWYKIAGHA